MYILTPLFTYQAHKPISYEYDQRKKKRPPPGAGDFLKDGGARRTPATRAAPPGDPCPRADLLRGAGGARGATWTAPQQQPRFHVAGKRAEEFVQNLAAEKGVDGLQKWMDQQVRCCLHATCHD